MPIKFHCTKGPYLHHDRQRFLNGFYCLGCNTFFAKDTLEYFNLQLYHDILCAISHASIYNDDNVDLYTGEEVARRAEITGNLLSVPEETNDDIRIRYINEALEYCEKLGVTVEQALAELKLNHYTTE